MSNRRYYWPLAVVTWLDAVEHAEGEDEPRHTPCRQRRAGWLLKDDAEGVSIASEFDTNDPQAYRGEHFIPRGMIEKVEIIRKEK